MASEKSHDRRSFFAQGFRALGRLFSQAVSEAVEETVTRASGGERHLRPPGAIDEAAFLLSCTRCGDCAKACPADVIKFLPASAGAAVGTPYIDPLERACDLCGKCMPVCEPAALLTVADPRQVRIGLAVIDPSLCWAYGGSICDLCFQHCPYPNEAIKLVGGKPQIVADACTGCGQCVYVCVNTPVAIRIEPRH